MVEMKPETVLPTIAVQAFKHREFVRVQTAIIRAALANHYICSGDIQEDIVAESSKQGVKSNAWNALRALEIIERVPLGLTIDSLGIYGGRKRNKNPDAKGRFVAVYVLKSRSLALTWLQRNGQSVQDWDRVAVQEEMVL